MGGSIKFSFFLILERSRYQTEITSNSDCITTKLNEFSFDTYIYKDMKYEENYLIIDCNQLMGFETFSELAYSILIGIGFMTGKFIQNEGYYFKYQNECMEKPIGFLFSEFRDSIQLIYTPLYKNAYAYACIDNDIAKEYHDSLSEMTLNSFSVLCQKINDIPDFKVIILLILESCSSSLLLMPAGLSVALEALTNLLKKKNEKKKRRKLDAIKTLKQCFIQELEKVKSKLHDEEELILRKKINDLDRPTNKSKLAMPFFEYGVLLNENDMNVINRRNHFLHGRVSMGYYKKKQDEKANREMLYSGLKLYTLMVSLILRWVGFEGYVLNHAKIYPENKHELTKEEPFFIKI